MLKKVVLAGMALVVAVILLTGCGDDGLPDGTLAQVGEVSITQEQLDAKAQQIIAQLKDQAPDKNNAEEYKDFEQRVLDYMILLEIAKVKGPELEANVTDADVQEQLDQVKAMFGGDETKFQDALKEEGLTLEQLQANLRERLVLTKLSEAATKDAAVSDEQLQAYYDENKAEFQQDETRNARHILVQPEGEPDASGNYTDAQWAAALAEAEKVRTEIQNGADFAAKATEVSDDPGSKEQGGDLGEVQKGTMVPEFDAAVFGQEKGVLSEPVRTQYGYHLIQVMEINAAKQLTFEEVKEQIRAQLLEGKKSTAWDEWLKQAKIDLKVLVAEGMEYVTTTTVVGGTATTAAGTATTAGGTATTVAPTETTAP